MKNKKLLTFVFVLVLVLSIMLIACEKKGDAQDTITYGEWEVLSMPSTESAGQIKRTGSDGSTQLFDLPALTSDAYIVDVLKEPSCLEDGKTQYTINTGDDSYIFTIVVPKIGHDYSVTYAWNDAHTSCVATHICANDSSHNEIIEAAVTSEVTLEPTCTTKGKTTYTATFDEEWAKTQVVEIENIDALGHNYSVEYVWSEDGKSCVAHRICSRDAHHNETATATITSAKTKNETFETKGETTYTATFDKEWAKSSEAITKVVADIPMFTLSKVEALAPTVNSVGNIEYYVGTDGKYYDDANRTNEITLASTVMPKLEVTKVDKREPSYGTDGQKEYYYETKNNAKKYYLGSDGIYTAIPSDEDLVIPELSGTSAIYVNEVLTDATITYLQGTALDVHTKSIKDIVDAINGVDYSKYELYDKDGALIENIQVYLDANPNEPIHVYKYYAVTFDGVNGKDATIVDYKFGTKYGDVANAEYAGYTFNGWYDAQGVLLSQDAVIEAKAHTFTAKWYDAGLKFGYIDDNSNNNVILNSYTGTSVSVVIPDRVFSLGNKPVTKIGGNAFIADGKFSNDTITSITLPSTLTELGVGALNGLTNVTKLTLPDGIKRIEKFALSGMIALTSITIPSGIEYIAPGFATACDALTTMDIENGGNELYVSSLDGVPFNGVMYVGSETIPERDVFMKGDSVAIRMPAINQYDFIMGSITGTIPSNAKRIHNDAFNEVMRDSITIPASVEEIMTGAITDNSISNIIFEESTLPLVIRESAITDCQLANVVLPARITDIGELAFDCNSGLKLYIENTAKPNYSPDFNKNTEGSNSYYNVYLYRDIPCETVEESATATTGYWHYDDNNLPVIWDTVYTLEGNIGPTFSYGVKKVKSTKTDIVIPDAYDDVPITSVYSHSFDNAKRVTNITLGENIDQIDGGVFETLELTDINIMNKDVLLLSNAFAGSTSVIKNYKGPAHAFMYMHDNGLGREASSTLETLEIYGAFDGTLQMIRQRKLKSAVISNSVPNFTFNDCPLLESIVFDCVLSSISSSDIIDCPALKSLTFAHAENYINRRDMASDIKAVKNNGGSVTYGYNNILSQDGLFKYQVIGDKLYVLDYVGGKDITVPSSIDGMAIAQDAYYMLRGSKTIENVTFADDIKTSPDYLAEGAEGIKSVAFNKVETIGMASFVDNINLATIDFGAVNRIGQFGLANIGIANLVLPDSIKTIDTTAFVNSKKLVSVNLGNGVETMGSNAFYNCAALTDVIIGDKLQVLSNSVFGKCPLLTNITIGSGVKEIGYGAFSGCGATTIVVPNGVTNLGNAFGDCANLEYIILPNTLISINKGVVSNMTKVYFSDSLTAELKANSAFAGKEIYVYSKEAPTVMEKGITGYWHYGAEGNIELWQGLTGNYFVVELLDNKVNYSVVEYVGESNTIEIPATHKGRDIIEIQARLFEGKSNITSVTIPNTIKYIREHAFDGCNISTLTIENDKKNGDITIGDYAFANNSLVTLSLPNYEVKLENCSFANNTSLTKIIANGYVSGSDAGTEFDGCTNVKNLSGASSVFNINLPASVSCEIDIQSGYLITMTEKKYTATKLTIGKGVTLSNNSLQICNRINTVRVDEANPYFTSRDENGHEINSIIGKNDKKLYYGNTDGTIPSGTTEINDYAFVGATFESIYIPISVQYVSRDVFNSCANLTTINVAAFEATADSWGNGDWLYGLSVKDEGHPSGKITVNYGYGDIITTDKDFDYRVVNGEAYITKYKGNAASVVVPSTLGEKNVTSIVNAFTGNTTLEDVTLSANMTVVSAQAFSGCTALKTVDLVNVTELGEKAFYDCIILTDIDLKNVKVVGTQAFSGCDFTTLNIPSTVEMLGELAFMNNTNLRTINFETRADGTSDLREIGADCFSGAVDMDNNGYITQLVLPEGLVKIGPAAFSTINITSFHLPSTVREVSDNIVGYSPNLSTITVDERNPYFTSRNKEGKEINCIIYTGPTYQTDLYESMTANTLILGGLQSEIPDYVETFGQRAFNNRNISSITFPSKLKELRDYCFSACYKLTLADMRNTQLSVIQPYVFLECTALMNVYIPASITKIEGAVFSTENMNIYIGRSNPGTFNPNWLVYPDTINVHWDYQM